jgi:hypothetical protein
MGRRCHSLCSDCSVDRLGCWSADKLGMERALVDIELVVAVVDMAEELDNIAEALADIVEERADIAVELAGTVEELAGIVEEPADTVEELVDTEMAADSLVNVELYLTLLAAEQSGEIVGTIPCYNRKIYQWGRHRIEWTERPPASCTAKTVDLLRITLNYKGTTQQHLSF